MQTAEIRSVEFRGQRERSWRELEHLVKTVEDRGPAALSERDLLRLPALHRSAVSGLSVARAISLDRNLLEYLEGLTARSYFCVYGVRRRPFTVFWEFIAKRFPEAVRRASGPMFLSAAIMLLGVLIGFGLTSQDLNTYYSLVPTDSAQTRDPSASMESLRETLFDTDGNASGMLASFASFLFSHNSMIGILCFALGFAAGIPVFYLLLTNGVMLGAMSALFHARGLALEWWSWILPHGITELLAIVICGGAGFLQARALLFPGRRTRLASLTETGREAGQIVIGAIGMLFIAALIEGIFRQVVHDLSLRYSLATGTFVFWALYFGFAGRRARP